MSACKTEQGNLQLQVKTFTQDKPHMITPPNTWLLVKPTMGNIFSINRKFSHGFEGENVRRGQPRDIQKDTECERGRKKERAEKSRRLEGK